MCSYKIKVLYGRNVMSERLYKIYFRLELILDNKSFNKFIVSNEIVILSLLF